MRERDNFRFQFLCAARDEDYDAITHALPNAADIELDSGLTGLSVLTVALGSSLLRRVTDRAFEALCRSGTIRELKVEGPELKIEVRDVRARDLELLVNFVKALVAQSEDNTL